jgi:hypothetical protein
LRKNITKANRWRYAISNAYSVRGGISKMRYQLRHGSVYVETRAGPRGGMCVRVRDGSGMIVPWEDWMLAVTLMAQHDEERLLSVGHCGGYSLHANGCPVCRDFLAAKKKLEAKANAKRRTR